MFQKQVNKVDKVISQMSEELYKRLMAFIIDKEKCTVKICENHFLLTVEAFLFSSLFLPCLHNNRKGYVIIINNNIVFLMSQTVGNQSTMPTQMESIKRNHGQIPMQQQNHRI